MLINPVTSVSQMLSSAELWRLVDFPEYRHDYLYFAKIAEHYKHKELKDTTQYTYVPAI